MKKYIFGISPFSILLEREMAYDGFEIDGFTVNEDFMPRTWDHCKPIVPFEELVQTNSPSEVEIFISVGYKNMNQNRERVYRLCESYGLSVGTFIHSSVENKASHIGPGNIILNRCVISPFVELGACNIFTNDVIVGHETRVGDFNFFAGGSSTGGLVDISSHCFFGMKSVVNHSRKVADYTLLGAGVVLAKDSKPYTAVMPARNRNITASVESLGSLLV